MVYLDLCKLMKLCYKTGPLGNQKWLSALAQEYPLGRAVALGRPSKEHQFPAVSMCRRSSSASFRHTGVTRLPSTHRKWNLEVGEIVGGHLPPWDGTRKNATSAARLGPRNADATTRPLATRLRFAMRGARHHRHAIASVKYNSEKTQAGCAESRLKQSPWSMNGCYYLLRRWIPAERVTVQGGAPADSNAATPLWRLVAKHATNHAIWHNRLRSLVDSAASRGR
jgi:hypothetical protein